MLAANQGLYNGFLAAGLLWAVFAAKTDVALFFLGCVVVAALYGAYSVNKRIFYVQGVPALAASTSAASMSPTPASSRLHTPVGSGSRNRNAAPALATQRRSDP